MTHKILVASYHRNGVAGAGFYVAIVETTDEDGTDRFLCVDFTGEDEDYDYGRFAVLRVDRAGDSSAGSTRSRRRARRWPLTRKQGGSEMRRWDRFMASAARHPGAFTWGMREFRSWVTRAYDDDDQRQAYDVGRELAHMATLRRFDGRQ